MNTIAKTDYLAAIRRLHSRTSIEVSTEPDAFENFTDLDVCKHCQEIADEMGTENVSEAAKWPCPTALAFGL
jgi:hypothetical protein